MSRPIALLIFALALFPIAIRAADYGPARTVGQIRAQARRLLARQVRASGVDPKDVVISKVSVRYDDARLRWQAGAVQGSMTLTRRGDRWWDTTPDPDTAAHDWKLAPAGTKIAPPHGLTAEYGFVFVFAPTSAQSPIDITQIYARPPTPAEFLPSQPVAPGWGYANAVCFFDLAIGGAEPLVVKPGTTIDVWFPFVLDDQLQYSISFFSDERPSGLIKGSIFDNTVHFVLPEFTLAPGKPLMAEIDGDPMPSH